MIERPDPQATATCAFCPKMCRTVCPVAEEEKRETVTPWGLMTALHLEEKGHSALSGEGAQVLWRCLECRRCQQHCLDHVDVPTSVQGARFGAFKRGDAPPRARSLVKRFATHGNPYGRDLTAAARGAVSPDDVDSAADAILFPDCATAARYPEHLPATLKVLRAAGVGLSLYARDVSCCGAPLYHAGDLEGFTAHARLVQRALRGKQRVVVPSPGCAHLMRDVYPEVGCRLSAEVSHPVEILADRADRLPVQSPSKAATVYQDPCHLARSLGQVEAPRRLIQVATGARPRDPQLSGPRASCSGGGGGMPAIVPEVAAGVARRTAEGLDPQPSEVVVTACPSCRRRLERAGIPAPVKDLMEVLAEAL